MIISLHVKDYALIESISINFDRGLNIITGETGAGKSIIIDAMNLLLGERASNDTVRKGSEKSIVEGIFNVAGNSKVNDILKKCEIEGGNELIVRREISVKDSNRCFLNDTPVTLATIHEIGNVLVDLHGQHDHQSLLRSSVHLEVLDDFADVDELLAQYMTHHGNIREITQEIFLIKNKEKSLAETNETSLFQLKEIGAVDPQPGEEEKLIAQLKLFENSEKLAELTGTIYNLSYESENSISSQLSAVKKYIEELNNIDESFKEKVEEIKSAAALVEDVSEFVRRYKQKIKLEGSKLEELRDRLGTLSLLKKRYGGSIESVIAHRTSLSNELEEAQNFASKINDLEIQLQQERSSAGVLAHKLSSIRIPAARRIENDVVRELRELGIEDAEFDIRIRSYEANEGAANYIIVGKKNYKFNSRGIDEVDFLISLNIGEDLKPLSKVASGGEISRIMLALKTILAKNDKLPLLIFDEIDSGISGRIASIVGESMKELSEYHQIIAITHLPQIASNADIHFMVEKVTKDERVTTSIKKLDKNERVLEVAKLLSGDKITEASMISAREMIGIINTG